MSLAAFILGLALGAWIGRAFAHQGAPVAGPREVILNGAKRAVGISAGGGVLEPPDDGLIDREEKLERARAEDRDVKLSEL